MEINRERGVSLGGFSGIVSDADPRDIPKDALQTAINVAIEIPGEVASRRGLVPGIRQGDTKYSFWDGAKTSHLVTRDVLDNPVWVWWESNGTNGQMIVGNCELASPLTSDKNETLALHDSTRGYLSANYSKPTIARTSAGEVFVANGFDPMMKWSGRIGTQPKSHVTSKVGNQFLPAGIDAPTAAPTIVLDATGGGLIVGDYLLAYRYKDYEGNPSNLSPYYTASSTATGSSVSWTITQPSAPMPSYDRISEIELFRTQTGVADTFFKIASLPIGTSTYADLLTDEQLGTSANLLLENNDGSLNANRFDVPPLKPIVTWHQDRMYAAGSIVLSAGTVSVASGASTGTGSSTTFKPSMAGWEMTLDVDGADETYAVASFQGSTAFTLARTSATTFTSVDFALRPSLSERNTIYFSEADEPEAWPASQNYLVLQSDSTGSFDEGVVSLMSFGPSLYALKPTTMYRIDSVTQPQLDASISPAFNRGVFNHWCWTQVDGMAFMMDRLGCYVFNHQAPQPIGDSINNYFRDALIDFSKAANFFVSSNRRTKTVRFHVALTSKNQSSNYPMWAFSYNYRTKAWAIEQYPWGVTGAGTFRKADGSEQYYVFPEGYAPHYETTGGVDYLPAHIKAELLSISNTAASGNDYTCRLGLGGLDATYTGCPIAFVSGTGKGVYGIITGVYDTDVYTARLFNVVSPLALPMAGDELYLGGIPYSLKTKRFNIIESQDATRREVSVWFTPQTADTRTLAAPETDSLLTEDGSFSLLLESDYYLALESNSTTYSTVAATNEAAFDIRHYVDARSTPVNADKTHDSGDDQVSLVEGSPDGVALMCATRGNDLITGVARKQFGPSVLMHDVPSNRMVDIEIRGVSAEERHRFNQVDLEGAS